MPRRDPHPFFADRGEGGRALAGHLEPYLEGSAPRVVTLSPGGEQVAAGVAAALGPAAADGPAVIVDDGLTGAPAVLAEVERLRADGAARVIYAVPVAEPEAPSAAYEVVDAVVCVKTPEPLKAESDWYAA